MTKVKTQSAADMPVTARNAAKADALRAARAIWLLKAKHGSYAAISQELKNAGHAINRGLLCAVMNGKRQPSRELLIALGIRKPPRVLTDEEREARREARKTTEALWTLRMAAHAGYTVTMSRNADTLNMWVISLQHPVLETIADADNSFVDVVQRVHQARFSRLTQNDKTN